MEFENAPPVEDLRQRLHFAHTGEGPLVLLDGAMGTELTARGHRSSLPLWSAEALLTPSGRENVLETHKAYIQAGANIITTNTFRTTPGPFIEAFSDKLTPAQATFYAERMTLEACKLAKRAIAETAEHPVWVAGAITNLEDPDVSGPLPDDATLYDKHRKQVDVLNEGGVDFILAETITTKAEAIAILTAARDAGMAAAVSFQTLPGGLLRYSQGEPTEGLEAAVLAAAKLNPLFISINCVSQQDGYESMLHLRSVMEKNGIDIPLAFYFQADGYADSEHPSYAWNYEKITDPAGAYMETVSWCLGSIAGIGAFGGCCGTRPDFTARMRDYADAPTSQQLIAAR